jgi:DNA-binding beta-propeller fold protein YncE/mono/diheme cytochrome c family protein
MNKRMLGAVVALLGVLALGSGCASPGAGGGSTSNGSIGVSFDDALLYAADPDLDALFVVDAKTQATVARVQLGRQPEKVLVAPDDTIYVTNRLGRSVSVVRRGETTESARIPVGVEPVGLAISADGKTLYVVNATSLSTAEYGTLMAIDTGSRSLSWEAPLGLEPRGIALLPNGRAMITLYKTGDVMLVDLAKGAVISGGSDLFVQLNRSALGAGGRGSAFPNSAQVTSHPRALEAIVASSAGDQIFVAGRISTDAVIATNPAPLGAPLEGASAGYSQGNCGSSAVTSPSLFSFNGEGAAAVDDLGTCGTDLAARPPTLLTSSVPGMPVQGPRAMVTDPTGSFLYIANFESNNVAVVATATRPSGSTFGSDPKGPTPFGTGGTISALIDVGAGPTGIAVSHDGKRAWVYNSFDHSISRLEPRAGGQVVNAGTTRLADDVLSADVVAGRKLFFSAADGRMNSLSTGIACGSCHLEGREDGHVWNFPEGPRQTPSLAGRMLAQTAPYHWNGEFNDLSSFMALTVQQRMGGSGVTPVMERQIATFLDAQSPADNPNRGSTAPEVTRGQAIFAKAGCDGCHVGAALTNDRFADVGTFATSGPVVDNVTGLPHGGLNTPSLLGVNRSAPYLHTGLAPTLKARILMGKAENKHGSTAQLSDAEVDDLVAYVKTF